LLSTSVPLAGLRCIRGNSARAEVAGAAVRSPRAIASRRGRQSSGAGRLPYEHARTVNGRGGGWASFVTTCLPVDPPSSLRSAADRTGDGGAFGPSVGRKGAFGLRPGAIRGVSRGAAGGRVERGRPPTGLGLPRGSRSSRRSWGFARVRYDGLDRSPAASSYRSLPAPRGVRSAPSGARCEGSSAPSHLTPLSLSGYP